ncbi:ABC transporter substrate-binding protein [Terrabacter aerolatus]|uniref:Peptide ABC transporter substrate-binding protein n=1 Tax=Terrabacter aerolatus TaxID=422442 RepID=A0A512D2C2_9MICO|nr:ABC transporter substrate-binding protein [Terrabacter aerolatus]GEO30617.1 peptide ABC transporter substrate-binding protein [Terrabacter aerolatus]
MTRTRTKPTLIVTGLTAAALALTGCAGSASQKDSKASADGMIDQLTFPSEADAAVGGLVNYNPNSPKPLTATWLYEPLIVRNSLTCEETPWLATKSTWEGGNKLTFDIRDGVKWSDGQAFTAKDVAFTFNLMKQYPAFDKAGVWNNTFGAPAKSVTAQGNQVVFEFTGNAAPKYDGIIATKILPEHVYSKVGDPTKYVDKTPVSTGPYKVGSYNGRRLVLERRADYWQADKVKVQKIVLEGQYDAAQAALKLRAGQLDAYYGEVPNPKKTFVDADPKNNHFYYAPNGMTVLTGNDQQKPFSDVKFREAISYAMNKQDMSLKATYGVMKPASQTGLKLPSMASLVPAKYSGEDTVLPYDLAKANQLLDAAGYKKGADGKRTNPDGSPLSVNFSVQAGFIDYQAIADVVVKGLNDIGVNSKVTASAPDSVDGQKKTGDFQLMLEYLHGGCELAKNIGAKLSSTQIPTKTDIFPNVQRFSDPAVDAAVTKLASDTDKESQKADLAPLVDTMMTKFPVTALIYAPARILYRTDKAVGWPSEDNAYANPQDDKLLVLTHLTAPK